LPRPKRNSAAVSPQAKPPLSNYSIDDAFIGNEYGDPTEAGLDAIVKMASTECILLDPVYSGKVFYGLLSHLEDGLWPAGSRILMIHSGGAPALFAYHQQIKDHLRNRGLDISF
jgi:1-aminocyclopropane-1-carboxylate deaminase/D-cysteine desulfhydrase-like pyridoxal-dependent ACC family enzyme